MTTRVVDNTGRKEEIACPPPGLMYNQYMNGVDLADQKKSTYMYNRKNRRWYLRLFWHIVDVAITNAHIIYLETEKHWDPQAICMNQLDFRTKLVDSLIGGFSSRKRAERPCIDTLTNTNRRTFVCMEKLHSTGA